MILDTAVAVIVDGDGGDVHDVMKELGDVETAEGAVVVIAVVGGHS